MPFSDSTAHFAPAPFGPMRNEVPVAVRSPIIAQRLLDWTLAPLARWIFYTGLRDVAFVWTTIRSLGDRGRIRMATMVEFLPDFEQGRQAGRYLPHERPNLPFGGEVNLSWPCAPISCSRTRTNSRPNSIARRSGDLPGRR